MRALRPSGVSMCLTAKGAYDARRCCSEAYVEGCQKEIDKIFKKNHVILFFN